MSRTCPAPPTRLSMYVTIVTLFMMFLGISACDSEKHNQQQTSKVDPADRCRMHNQDRQDGIFVLDGWVRAPSGPARVAAGYFLICNQTGDEITLTNVSSNLADFHELHETVTQANGNSAMRPVGPVVIEPQGHALFQPGGRHIMFIDLTAPVREGEMVDITFSFDDDDKGPQQQQYSFHIRKGPKSLNSNHHH